MPEPEMVSVMNSQSSPDDCLHDVPNAEKVSYAFQPMFIFFAPVTD